MLVLFIDYKKFKDNEHGNKAPQNSTDFQVTNIQRLINTHTKNHTYQGLHIPKISFLIL